MYVLDRARSTSRFSAPARGSAVPILPFEDKATRVMALYPGQKLPDTPLVRPASDRRGGARLQNVLFELPFEEIANTLGRTPSATRQLTSRARRRVNGAEIPAPEPDLRGNSRWSTPSTLPRGPQAGGRRRRPRQRTIVMHLQAASSRAASTRLTPVFARWAVFARWCGSARRDRARGGELPTADCEGQASDSMP